MKRRLSAALFAFWFALYMGAPGLVHPCPEHSASAASATTADSHGDHGQHLDGALTGAGQDFEQSSEDHGCCCPGPQCGVGSMVLAEAPTVAAPEPGPRVAAAFRAPERAVGARPPYVLPYSTAPPASHA